jgi:flagellar export protein FliJ
MPKKETISKILKLKDSRKKEIEIEVKEAADRLDREEEKLLQLEKDYEDKLDFFKKKNMEGALDAGNISSYYDFFAKIDIKIKEQKGVRSKRQDELAVLKNSLVNAHKDKKMFEIMEDKAVKKEIREKIESEQKEADFFSLSRKVK